MHLRHTLAALPLAFSSLRGAAAVPTDASKHLAARSDDVDWAWPKCTVASEGTCTVYMATGWPLGPHGRNYRNFGIYDHECEIRFLYMTDNQDRDITLRAHRDQDIIIEVDEGTRPKGTITYAGHVSNLGDDLDCYDWGGQVDGLGCRRHLPCKRVGGIMPPAGGDQAVLSRGRSD